MNRRRSIVKSGRGLVLLLALVLGLSLGLVANPTWATNHCDATVTDGNSIQTAINSATDGQTICVQSGTYSGGITVTVANLTIEGADGAVINVASNQTGIAINANGVEVSGFLIQGPHTTSFVLQDWSATDAQLTFGISTDAQGVVISDNEIQHVRSGIQLFANSQATVTGNTINNTKGSILDRGVSSVISGNAPGATGNEWDIVVLTSVYPDNPANIPTYVPASTSLLPLQTDLSVYGQAMMALSQSNGEMTILDRRYPTANVSHVFVQEGSSPTAADDFGIGNGIGNPRQPLGGIQHGITAVAPGGIINVAAGTYVESNSIVIDKDLTIVGDQSTKPVIKPNGNQNAAWFSVSNAATFNMSNVVLDGDTHFVWTGIQVAGATATLDGVDFKNIQGSASGQPYRGVAIAVFGGTVGGGAGAGTHASAHLALSGSTFEQIGRIGVLVKGDASTANISGNTYTGKGDGDFLDYAFEVGAGGSATIIGNTITNNKGVAATDGSNSAGILVTAYYGNGTETTITGNHISGSTTGINVGYVEDDDSSVAAHFNNLEGNDNGIISTWPTVDGRNNWWGSASGPTHVSNPEGTGAVVSNNVLFDPWLGAETTTVDSATGSNASVTTTSGPNTNGVSAVLSGGSSGATLTVAEYEADPTNANLPGTLGGPNGVFFDVNLSGNTDPNATLTLDFYFNDVTIEGHQLYWHNGTTWLPVKDMNGNTPVANGDGNYVGVMLNANSSPSINDLTGTPITSGDNKVRVVGSGDTSIGTIAEGETIQLIVEADSPALYGVDITVEFDEAKLEVTGVALGGGIDADTVAVNNVDNGNGSLRFAYSQASPDDNVPGNKIKLATITFLALDSVTTPENTVVSIDSTASTLKFSDKDGTGVIPGEDGEFTLTVNPSPSVYADVTLQGRSSFLGISLEMEPTSTGNVLFDGDGSTAAGRLEISPVPSGEYDIRVSAAKYLAAVKTDTVPDEDTYNLTPSSLHLLGGDINGDDRINIQDLVLIGASFDSNAASIDINNDNNVNIQDLAIAAGNFGATTTTAYMTAGW